jgi:hypothetical protein
MLPLLQSIFRASGPCGAKDVNISVGHNCPSCHRIVLRCDSCDVLLVGDPSHPLSKCICGKVRLLDVSGATGPEPSLRAPSLRARRTVRRRAIVVGRLEEPLTRAAAHAAHITARKPTAGLHRGTRESAAAARPVGCGVGGSRIRMVVVGRFGAGAYDI